MPTKNQIIEALYRSKDFCDCINKMDPAELRDDLKAEVTLVLLEKPDTLIEQLHGLGQLKFYAVRVIMNLIQSKTSPFYKKYRTTFLDIDSKPMDASFSLWTKEQARGVDKIIAEFNSAQITDHSERKTLEELQDLALANLSKLSWYEKGIIDLYMKLGNYRAIEADTGIPWESAYKTIQKSIQKIRDTLPNITA